ncbi:hypothetical protein JCM19241_1034 [Vibrio ishigakensis]|uniref:Uncharacterized protein n=1 Tax=Vibrio ishigakensis TaxID=1481914 RepID=A0A0B8Q7W2_9VIBR|nr:hypothetical protein JCM19241_1034 [Vibrio ishigakensis]
MSKTNKLHNEDKLVKRAIEVVFKLAKMQGIDLPDSTMPLKVKSAYLSW